MYTGLAGTVYPSLYSTVKIPLLKTPNIHRKYIIRMVLANPTHTRTNRRAAFSHKHMKKPMVPLYLPKWEKPRFSAARARLHSTRLHSRSCKDVVQVSMGGGCHPAHTRAGDQPSKHRGQVLCGRDKGGAIVWAEGRCQICCMSTVARSCVQGQRGCL